MSLESGEYFVSAVLVSAEDRHDLVHVYFHLSQVPLECGDLVRLQQDELLHILQNLVYFKTRKGSVVYLIEQI